MMERKKMKRTQKESKGKEKTLSLVEGDKPRKLKVCLHVYIGREGKKFQKLIPFPTSGLKKM